MPFLEDGCEILLKKMIGKKRIIASDDLTNIKKSKYIIICLGTPVNKKFNPILKNFINFFYSLKKHLSKKHIVIISPGAMEKNLLIYFTLPSKERAKGIEIAERLMIK